MELLPQKTHALLSHFTENNLRYININKTYNQLGETLCESFSAHRALTGCDFSASFVRKGKTTTL